MTKPNDSSRSPESGRPEGRPPDGKSPWDPSPRGDRRLLRWLLDPDGENGTLTAQEAGELRARLEREPELAARFARLRRSWEALETPPDVLPPGFGHRVMAQVREAARRRESMSLATAPVWVRTAAALALVLGLGVGFLMARLPGSQSGPSATVEVASLEVAGLVDAAWREDGLDTGLEESPSLADTYLSVLEGELDSEGRNSRTWLPQAQEESNP